MLAGKRIAILAEDGFEDSELIEPLRAMKGAGARTTIVGSGSQESYTGKRGFTIRVDTTADKEYICLDNTDTAAVWTETTQTAAGATPGG